MYSFYCYVHQSGSNQEGKHTAMGTGKVECQEEVPSVEQSGKEGGDGGACVCVS